MPKSWIRLSSKLLGYSLEKARNGPSQFRIKKKYVYYFRVWFYRLKNILVVLNLILYFKNYKVAIFKKCSSQIMFFAIAPFWLIKFHCSKTNWFMKYRPDCPDYVCIFIRKWTSVGYNTITLLIWGRGGGGGWWYNLIIIQYWIVRWYNLKLYSTG